MVLGFFKKATGAGTPANSGRPARDPKKAVRFFQHAETVAESRQYDYAIECYINGLRHDPGNMSAHEALREVAKRRKVNGGGPPSFSDKMKMLPKDPVEKMLHAEAMWAKDPLALPLMVEAMDKGAAVVVDLIEPDLGVEEYVFWVGNIIIDQKEASSMPDKKTMLRVCELFQTIGAYAEAVHACKMAIMLDPKDTNLLNYLKNLEAENTIDISNTNTAKGGGFRGNVKDTDKQKQLEQESQIDKSDQAKDDMIARAKKEFDEKPDDLDRVGKLVDAYMLKDTDSFDEECVKLLSDAFKKSTQYRFKFRVGDVKMRIYARKLKDLKTKLDAKPEDPALKKAFQEAARVKLQFELDEFTERVKNYPTDLNIKFELAHRLFLFQKYVDAIGVFQQAKVDPKLRAKSQEFLGKCYQQQGWFDEAIAAFKEGIDAHPLADDALGMSLRFNLMDALAHGGIKNRNLAMAQEAMAVGSVILRTNINYKNIQERMEKIRKLVNELKAGGGAAAPDGTAAKA